MSLLSDTYVLFSREMLIFRKNFNTNVIRMLIFPIIFILLLGSLGNSSKNVPVALVNYDNGPLSLSFISLLSSGNALLVASYTTEEQAMSLLDQGKVAAVIVVPPGFSIAAANKPSVYVYLTNTQPLELEVVESTVKAAAAELGTGEVLASAPAAGQDPVPVVTNYAVGAGSNYETFVVGGIVILVASFGAVFSSGFTMLSDRQLGNLKAFLVTPIDKFSILLSKIIYGTFQSVFSAYIGLAIGLALGASIAAGLLGFFELLWFVLLVGLGFGALSIALAVRMKQIQTYAFVAQTLTLPLAFLAGAFIPVNLLPSLIQPIATVDPLTYAVNAVRTIMISGSLPLSTFAFDSGVLLAFAAVMVAVAVLLFRNTSEQV